MAERIIRGRRVENDVWVTLGRNGEAVPQELPAGPIIVPLAVWKARGAELVARRQPLGVWLDAGEEPADIAADLDKFTVVAVHFPKYGDGRGYSTAVLLRTRYGYSGELRAFGDIARDHLHQLARVGFDAFRLADHRDPEDALAAFAEYSLRYQGSVDDPLPLFRKRENRGQTTCSEGGNKWSVPK